MLSSAEASTSAIVALLSAFSAFSLDSSFLWKVCDSERLTAKKLFGSLTLSAVSFLFFVAAWTFDAKGGPHTDGTLPSEYQ